MFRGGEIGYMDIFKVINTHTHTYTHTHYIKVIEKTMEAHKKDLNMAPSLDDSVS